MQVIKKTNFNFIGNRNKALMVSGVLILITIIVLIMRKGPNLSIDFVGGTVIQLGFEKSPVDDLGKIRSLIGELGIGSPEVRRIGQASANEIQITVKRRAGNDKLVGDQIRDLIASKYSENPFEVLKIDQVGPKVGSELRQTAILAILLSLLAIVGYMALRFHLPFGVGAVVALFHDVIITLGAFAIMDFEISLPIIAAFLTIVGYSVNDTIVIFDRVRENLRQGSLSKMSLEDKLNLSINQTLSRTIITSVSTLFTVSVIYGTLFMSADVVKYFAFALLIGMISGTYSTIFIANPVVIFWHKKWPVDRK